MTENALSIAARVCGIGLVGPGADDWGQLRERLLSESGAALAPTRIPNPEGLPPAERRRVGKVVKLAMAAGLAACRDAGIEPAIPATVFASSGGDGENCHAICELLAGEDRLISPIRFHNSVNNAASGYWGIATGAQSGSSVVSAFDGSFAVGLLEAFALVATEGAPVLLVTYDHPYPSPLAESRPLGPAFGVGLLLRPEEVGPGPSLRLLGLSDAPADRLSDPVLEALRQGAPAARALPLLSALARAEAGRVALDYLDGRALLLEVAP
ncbi:beta-ketoacyl synthase chain length factor [Thiorhodococcus minor]|uniref:Beta-ketoacyl synthase chain length factor n=1 Tax=Thiorhodococcus minor TaxID=57489 RepID=A0A6M0K0F4_9GAMM|nr:beta-ketoacyl synthase chain length factor [Thiorhodococcus minor]NEV62077.1 beta-ketoacyl synthase chain length factor [Thiorhodococcus minor]